MAFISQINEDFWIAIHRCPPIGQRHDATPTLCLERRFILCIFPQLLFDPQQFIVLAGALTSAKRTRLDLTRIVAELMLRRVHLVDSLSLTPKTIHRLKARDGPQLALL